jgi:serine phosphatase RsbU (regulator of sigma subunit)
MEEAARKFARRIIAVHLALLLLVVSIVYVASREVYNSSRKQATEQARSRQALLAAQTARGIESFYQSVFNDLDLLREADREYDENGNAVEPPPTTQKSGDKFGPRLTWKDILSFDPKRNVTFRSAFAPVLWTQLQGRVTHLFSVDRRELERPEGMDVASRPPPAEKTNSSDDAPRGERRPPGDRPPPGDRTPAIAILGPPQKYRPHPREIVARSREWILGAERPTISSFQQYDVGGGEPVGLNLIAVPTNDRNPRVLVAAVDVRFPRSKFIDTVNTDADSTLAVLIDDAGTVMATASKDQTGTRVMEMLQDDLKPLARRYLGTGLRGSEIVPRAYSLGNRQYPPSLFNLEPVTIAGKKWTLMMISPLADVDLVVARVFQRAVFWAFFVVCSMTAILLSTSIQLIRSRARIERLRHDVLTRELSQAREIQLAWLPQDKISVPAIDIAAINHPASHISGDFYNWFELPDGRTVVSIGDVTGHGMSAAFLMATTQLLVHSTMLRLQDPGKTLQEVNDQLTRQVFNGQFVTMLICVLDVNEGTMEVATAGHHGPILGDGGRFVPLPIEHHLVLGIEKNVEYPTERYPLPPTASLILFTDGVTDARAVDGQRFDLDRLVQTLNASRAESAQQLIDTIVGRINQFRQTRELPDDLTLVCIQTLAQRTYQSTEALSV